MFEMRWSRLERLHLALHDENIDVDSFYSDLICWTAGLHYGLSLIGAMTNGEFKSNGDVPSRVESLVSSAAARLEKVFCSKRIERQIAVQNEFLGEGETTSGFRTCLAFLEINSHPSKWLPKKSVSFIQEDPTIENRIRFFFGLGVATVNHLNLNPSANAFIEDGCRFFLPGDESGESAQRMRQLIVRELSWTIPE